MKDSERVVVRVHFDFTLMRFIDEFEAHVQSGARPKTWFLEVPRSWVGDGKKVTRTLERIFVAENVRLRERAVYDRNYPAVLGSRHELIEPPGVGPFPWELEERVLWESSSCWGSPDPDGVGTWLPMLPRQFSRLYLLRRAEREGVGSRCG